MADGVVDSVASYFFLKTWSKANFLKTLFSLINSHPSSLIIVLVEGGHKNLPYVGCKKYEIKGKKVRGNQKEI